MIKEDELSKLLAEAEADRIERTTSTKDTDKFSEAVTAFSNDLLNHRLPGYLVVALPADCRFQSRPSTDWRRQRQLAATEPSLWERGFRLTTCYA